MAQPQPPNPPAHWFLGNMGDFNRDTLHYLLDAANYGDVVRFRFGPVPTFWLYFVNHPDDVRDVLVTHADKFHKPRRIKWTLEDITGESLFTGDGDFWKQQRKLMQPAFHSKHIGSYAETMVAFTQRALRWEDGAPLDMHEEMTALTMDIITKTMFDTEVGPQSHEIGAIFTELFEIANQRSGVFLGYPSWLPLESNRRARTLVARVREVVQGFIEQRRRTGEARGDLLDMLLAAQYDDGSGMSDEQIMREALTIFGAGHETTANALTFTWYTLSQNPEAEATLHEEVDRVLGGRAATLADLPHLPYTEMVIKETMRLYPPAWAISRESIAEVDIGGYRIPPGTPLLVSPWTLGRDARWFAEPERFDPERFTPENEAQLPRYAYIPFGGGPRVCIGNQFAMMEARLILATMAQRYRFQLQPGFVMQPKRAFTLRSQGGLKMIAHLREDVQPSAQAQQALNESA